ncbi:OadG family protein [Thermococcus atlanticus]
MISMAAFMEGLYITILGVSVVFGVLIILSIAMYAIGKLEVSLVEREEKPVPAEEVKAEKGIEEKPKLEPRKVAVITAAVLAYTAEKAAQLRPLPFKRKPSDAWRLYGLHSQMEEVENFNYEMGEW